GEFASGVAGAPREHGGVDVPRPVAAGVAHVVLRLVIGAAAGAADYLGEAGGGAAVRASIGVEELAHPVFVAAVEAAVGGPRRAVVVEVARRALERPVSQKHRDAGAAGVAPCARGAAQLERSRAPVLLLREPAGAVVVEVGGHPNRVHRNARLAANGALVS